METGTVKFFNDAKGYGFISQEGGSGDLFVHVSGLIDEIREGDKVTFVVGEGKKGPMATDVRLA